ncbi:PREDICTED: protein lin-52 homolog [Nanorana parkeri]|uniref:protein lin-52 homolog n=1 Tax=Nanorana parkeri TaxID=125878 RepID=UPI00085461FC|nr:PREDICTED: protein lin-52 homolog [Nanorana parkeri]
MAAAAAEDTDLETSLLSFEKLDRASPDLWPEQRKLNFALHREHCGTSFLLGTPLPIASSPPKWMAELENDDIEMLSELGSLTITNLMEKVRGLQNLAYQLGLEECEYLSCLSVLSSLYRGRGQQREEDLSSLVTLITAERRGPVISYDPDDGREKRTCHL